MVWHDQIIHSPVDDSDSDLPTSFQPRCSPPSDVIDVWLLAPPVGKPFVDIDQDFCLSVFFLCVHHHFRSLWEPVFRHVTVKQPVASEDAAYPRSAIVDGTAL